jgi:hypothetical protein
MANSRKPEDEITQCEHCGNRHRVSENHGLRNLADEACRKNFLARAQKRVAGSPYEDMWIRDMENRPYEEVEEIAAGLVVSHFPMLTMSEVLRLLAQDYANMIEHQRKILDGEEADKSAGLPFTRSLEEIKEQCDGLLKDQWTIEILEETALKIDAIWTDRWHVIRRNVYRDDQGAVHEYLETTCFPSERDARVSYDRSPYRTVMVRCDGKCPSPTEEEQTTHEMYG